MYDLCKDLLVYSYISNWNSWVSVRLGVSEIHCDKLKRKYKRSERTRLITGLTSLSLCDIPIQENIIINHNILFAMFSW